MIFVAYHTTGTVGKAERVLSESCCILQAPEGSPSTAELGTDSAGSTPSDGLLRADDLQSQIAHNSRPLTQQQQYPLIVTNETPLR